MPKLCQEAQQGVRTWQLGFEDGEGRPEACQSELGSPAHAGHAGVASGTAGESHDTHGPCGNKAQQPQAGQRLPGTGPHAGSQPQDGGAGVEAGRHHPSRRLVLRQDPRSRLSRAADQELERGTLLRRAEAGNYLKVKTPASVCPGRARESAVPQVSPQCPHGAGRPQSPSHGSLPLPAHSHKSKPGAISQQSPCLLAAVVRARAQMPMALT